MSIKGKKGTGTVTMTLPESRLRIIERFAVRNGFTPEDFLKIEVNALIQKLELTEKQGYNA